MKKPLILLFLVLLLLGFFALDLNHYLSLAGLKASLAQFEAQRAASPVLVGLVYFVLYVLVAELSLPGAAILTLAGGVLFGLIDVLCELHERKVDNDNCVRFEGMSMQIPADELRYHHVRAIVRVQRYVDDTLAVFHWPASWPPMALRACQQKGRRFLTARRVRAAKFDRAMAAKPFWATSFTAL